MSRRLDFEKASRNHQAKYGLSVKDEGEWMKNDAAANWLRNMEPVLQQVPMKLDHVCRVGKGARAPVVRVTCKLDCARRAHAVGCQWWARRAKRGLCPPYDSLRRNAL
jgi:hypothetical protein